MANGVAAETRSLSRTRVSAVVMSADLAIAGVQSGWACLSRAKLPATTGADMDVPAMAWKSSPVGCPLAGIGVFPAMIWTPGAVRSGLMRSPAVGFSPREEKAAIVGDTNGDTPIEPGTNRPVPPGVAAIHARSWAPGVASIITVGTKKVSEKSVSVSVALARTMPTPPARSTSALLATRPLPPLVHTTIAPVTTAGLRVPSRHSAPPAVAASTNGAAEVPPVTEAPRYRLPPASMKPS